MTEIMTFKKPSTIQFKLKKAEPKQAMLSQAQRGVTFLREGAICMRVDVSAYQGLKDLRLELSRAVKELHDNGLWIINLQTGRVFVSEDMPVEWIKLTVDVAGEL